MSNRSYEFDPCSIDGSDKEDEVTLDNWKPKEKKDTLLMSEWRQKQNNGSGNISPGIDELKKIMGFLQKKKTDWDIMKAFGISSETLVAIKRGCYSPVDGISLDNQSKIYKEFRTVQKNIDQLKEALVFIGDKFMGGMEIQKEFKKILCLNKKKKKPVVSDEEE